MFRGLEHERKTTITFILVNLFIFSLVFYSFPNTVSGNSDNLLFTNNIDAINPQNNLQSLHDLSSYSYNPVTNVTGTGDTFDVKDSLLIYDEFSLNMTYNNETGYFEEDFTINDITSTYDSSLLNYNMTQIVAKQDFYPIELEEDGSTEQLSDTKYALAQSFNVPWEYSVFFGAEIYLSTDGSQTGSVDLELVVVKAESGSGQPNMSQIYSSSVDGPYNPVNQIIDGFNYYDFTDVVLDQGDYFVVVIFTGDFTQIGPKFYFWHSNTLSPYLGDTYYMDNSYSWSLISATDLTLNVELLPSDQYGSTKVFTDLNTITLKDNDVQILNVDSSISSLGSHNLTSDTSIEIIFNNSYEFWNSYMTDSSFSAFNSTAGTHSIYWNLTWESAMIDPTPYSLFERTIKIITVGDWKANPVCYYNDTDIIPTMQFSDYYICYLDTNTSAGSFLLETSSPNYIQTLTLYDDTAEETDLFSLGYWITNELTSTGHEGSTITSLTSLIESVEDGQLNLTLFNPDGIIIPLKTSLPANLTYTDSSSYTILDSTPTFPGIYSSHITIDPSVYESDLEGIWNIFVYWYNGSEIGIYSVPVYIQSSTYLFVEWEEIPGNNNWVNSTAQQIERQNGDELLINCSYYKLSEPYFTSYGKLVENTTLAYTTSWGESGKLSEINDFHSVSFNTNITAGSYSIDIMTTDAALLEHQHSTLDLDIFNVFSVEIIQSVIESNSTDDLMLSFKLINETDPVRSSMSVVKSELSIIIQGEPVAQEDYYLEYEDGINTVVISSQAIRFNEFDLFLDITKANFKTSYIDDVIETTFDVTINQVSTPTTPPTDFPPYLIGIIIGGSILFIGAISIVAVVSRKRGRKQAETIVDVSASSSLISLFENILSLRKVLFIHNETSLPVFEYDIEYKKTVDTSLITGFLSVVGEMGKQIGGIGTGNIKKLEYKNFVVNTASSDSYSVFLFTSEEINGELTTRLFDLIMWFQYAFTLEGAWDGRMDMFVNKKHQIQDKISESLYIWLFFPMQVNDKKRKEIKKCEDIHPKLANFISRSESVTVSSLINEFEDLELHDILHTVFTCVNRECLLRHKF